MNKQHDNYQQNKHQRPILEKNGQKLKLQINKKKSESSTTQC